MLHGENIDLSYLRVLGALCSSRAPENSTAQPGKGRCPAIAKRIIFTTFGSQRLAMSWRTGTSPSSRHRRTCFPPPSHFSPLQNLALLSWDLDDTLDNGVLQDVRDFTGVLDFTANTPTNRENACGVSTNPQVQGLVDQIHYLTRRDLLTPTTPLPGAASSAEPLPGAAGGHSFGGASPKRGGLSPAPMLATARRGTTAPQQDSSAQHHEAACCRGADGRGYPL